MKQEITSRETLLNQLKALDKELMDLSNEETIAENAYHLMNLENDYEYGFIAIPGIINNLTTFLTIPKVAKLYDVFGQGFETANTLRKLSQFFEALNKSKPQIRSVLIQQHNQSMEIDEIDYLIRRIKAEIQVEKVQYASRREPSTGVDFRPLQPLPGAPN